MFSPLSLFYYQYGHEASTQCTLDKAPWMTSTIYHRYQPSYRTQYFEALSQPNSLTTPPARDSNSNNISRTLKFGIDNILDKHCCKDSNEDVQHHHTSLTVDDYCKPQQRRRPWSRPVFTQLQRRGLEKRFQLQKYITKHDRYQLAAMLGLSETQVKVWFQNRRTKWRQDMKDSERSNDDSKDDQDSDSTQREKDDSPENDE